MAGIQQVLYEVKWKAGEEFVTAYLIEGDAYNDFIYFETEGVGGLIPVLNMQIFVGYGGTDRHVKEYTTFMYMRYQYTGLLGSSRSDGGWTEGSVGSAIRRIKEEGRNDWPVKYL